MSKYILELTVFICGAVIMIFELVGSRVLGPYFGTSIFVWTSLIGIILGSLSLGYYLGGKIADKKPDVKNLSLIIFFAAIFIGITTAVKGVLLVFLQFNILDVRISSVIASFLLFLPASVLLGMIAPYAAKLTLDDLDNSGATIGNLYALSTAGSICGTFLAGFFLIPHFGTNKLLIIISIILVLVSLALYTKEFKKIKSYALIFLIFGWVMISGFSYVNAKNGFIDVDTAYNRIWIYDYTDVETGKMAKMMGINNENHSSMFLDSDELVSEYSKYYHLARYFHPDLKTALMLGGAGYSYPKYFLRTYPEATMDVVEIDPEITQLAKKYFRLKEDPRLNIYHKDGRVYLNKTDKKYDVIFGDAFGAHYSVPYQLTTKEATERIYDILEDDGIVILNIISALEGEKSWFFQAEYATYASIFPQVYVFPVKDLENAENRQNIMLIALKTEKEYTFESDDEQLQQYLQHLWKKEIITDKLILTDDYAPVDYYVNKAF
ncbi:MAG: fused MFS/spermidine synthase [Candidatus Magasanikbacteria bacterium]|nr:fused MFS/spermidine synthase [Candidatus Magasanikbacteria bacterium]